MRTIRFSSYCIGVVLLAGVTVAPAGFEVIYCEIAGQPTAIVPGARDADGNPVVAQFTALEELALRPDGGEWVIKGRSNLATTLDSLLLVGSGLVGTMLAQDGQPLQGGGVGEQYDFFDSPVPAAWNAAGDLAFSCRAKGGATNKAEKVVRVSGGVHTVIVQQNDAALGLIDQPPNPSGDETIGNSINSVHLLDSGEAAFVNTPIGNCHSNRYPAFFRGHTGFRQCGVSPIGGELWDDMDYDDCGGTSDGQHWFIKGDTDRGDTSTDNILAVDDQVVLREGSPVAGSSVTMAAIFFTRMLSDGTWFCRGDDPIDNDWAVRSGVLLAKTGDPIVPGENWGAVFTAFTGNRVGDWLLIGNTDATDPTKDNVMVLNGSEILAREGDPIDVDGNGQFDDDAYIATFQPNDAHLTDDKTVHLLVTLRNAAGTNTGDAFLRLRPIAFRTGDTNCDGVVNFDDIDPFVLALSGQAGYEAQYPDCRWLNADCDLDGDVDFDDIDAFVALLGG